MFIRPIGLYKKILIDRISKKTAKIGDFIEK